MTLRFRITWPNAHHALLADQYAAVTLAADGVDLAPLTKTVGERIFEVPPGAAKLDLRGTFSPSLPGALGASGHQETVLDVAQSYDVVAGGTAVRPIDQAAYLGPHPLVDTVQAANVHGAVHARIATTFVDITPFMPHYGREWNRYEPKRQAQSNVGLRALGCTEGAQGPLIWFASIPGPCVVPPSREISCVVFFRPAIGASYSRVDQPQETWRLVRYLMRPLAPVLPESRDDTELDRFKPSNNGTPGAKGEYVWIRAGFDDALDRSRKAVLMLHPWPHAHEFGLARTAKLPALATAAIRLLWAQQHIAVGRHDVTLGRLALAGYSAGGRAFWSALRSTYDRVHEVYAFDAAGGVGAESIALTWFRHQQQQGTAPCLRLVGGYQGTSHMAIKMALERQGLDVSGVTVTPELDHLPNPGSGAASWTPEWHKNPWFTHVAAPLLYYPTLPDNYKAGYWHQFAIFGGMPQPVLPPGVAVTYLQQFLVDSGFP